MAVRLFVSMAMFAVVLRTASSWSYDAQDQWDSTCFGSSQSPIDLSNRRVNKVDYGELTFSSSYSTAPATQHLVNDGHTAKLSFNSPLASISGGGLPTTQNFKYQYLQHHFHWGQTDDRGSEHLVNGIGAPLELHIVHWNTKYNDVNTALNKTDGVAVLGIMFKISPSDNTVLKPLIDQLPNIIGNGVPVDRSDFPVLEKLLPSDTTKFYRYVGSLTTPGCNEAVIWTVFADRQTISSNQLRKFRTLTDSSNNPITYNNRNVQNSNRNKLYYSRPAPVTAKNPFSRFCRRFPFFCKKN